MWWFAATAQRTNFRWIAPKLFSTLARDPARQATFYHPGIGTMEPPGALTPFRRRVSRVFGQAIGWGLENDIRDVYTFLMNYFQERDTLYMFGFSRGAYTVRAVASLLHMYGLLTPGNEPLIPYAIRMMNAANRKTDGKAFDLAEDFRATFRGPA